MLSFHPTPARRLRREISTRRFDSGVRRFASPASALIRIANQLSPQLKVGFLSAVKLLGNTVAATEVERAFGLNDIERIVQMMGWKSMEARLLKSVTSVTETAVSKGAVLGESKLPFFLRFDLTNPRSVSWIEQNAARLIVQISQDTKDAVRAMVSRAFTEGTPPRDLAKLIKETVGLHERYATAVYNYNQALVTRGMSPDRISKLTDAYAERLLNARALAIARTETLTAANRGQQELWNQAADQGLLDRNTTRRVWVLGPNPCDECEAIAAEFEGGVALDGVFTSGDDVFETPPAHVNCLCDLVLEFD